MKKLIKAVAKSSFAYSWFGNYQWYRRFVGGRWERWYIDVCRARLWLRIPTHEADDRWQACSVGPRVAREDYLE